MNEEAYRSGAAFAVTIATYHRRHFIMRRDVADLCVESLRESAKRYEARVFAYCFMPDHCHILGSVPDRSPIDLVRHFKQLSSFQSKTLLGGFPLWQARFFDRALRAEDEQARVALYILWNPVRAGLVETITDYPYSGSLIWPEMLASGFEDPDLHSPHLRKVSIAFADRKETYQ